MSTKSKQETKNTYEYVPTPVTPQVTQAETTAQDLRKTVDPRIRQNYAGMRQAMNESFDNPFGAHTTQAVRDASKRNSDLSLMQEEAQALAGADYMANATDFERQIALAELTAPRLVQTGGTTTENQSGGVLNSLLGGAFGLGSSYLGNLKPSFPRTETVNGITNTIGKVGTPTTFRSTVSLPSAKVWLG